jgi:hypothetical protein
LPVTLHQAREKKKVIGKKMEGKDGKKNETK